jgi:isochorismate synthase
MNDVFRGLIDAQAERLLAGYSGDDPFFFATPERTLLAQGRYAQVPQTGNLATLGQVVQSELNKARANGHPHPVVVGAVPFDARQPATLTIPHHVVQAGPLSRVPERLERRSSHYTIQPVPEPAGYAQAVAEAVRQIQDGVLSKVVLARTLELTGEQGIDVQFLLERLARRNIHGYTFAVRLDGGAGGTLVGASPELLMSRQGLQVRSNPLAGSAARAADAQEDARRSAALLRSAKDLHEHQVVADAVARGMRPYCRTLDVPAGPSLINTATMWHLSSDIRGELATPQANALQLAASLHPTPAVCGHPDQAAFELIRRLEPFERGYYTGMVGWCDWQGNGEWVVTLRCAQVQGPRIRLYAGAGVVADSDPDSEVAETGAKFRTMLNALGLAHEGVL